MYNLHGWQFSMKLVMATACQWNSKTAVRVGGGEPARHGPY